MKTRTAFITTLVALPVAAVFLWMANLAIAQLPTSLESGRGGNVPLSGSALVEALRKGGFVIVMRHASSPRETLTKETANADNVNLERQLDEAGRTTAAAMGKAIRDLKIPVGEVLSSPTYRALETIKFAQFANPKTFPELGDRGQSMQGVSDADAAWLKKKTTEAPKYGNTILVTHNPNLSKAFPEITGVEDGEALVFAMYFSPGSNKTTTMTEGTTQAMVIARIKIEEWAKMKP